MSTQLLGQLANGRVGDGQGDGSLAATQDVSRFAAASRQARNCYVAARGEMAALYRSPAGLAWIRQHVTTAVGGAVE